jgi:molybdate transport system substrate-binding protein
MPIGTLALAASLTIFAASDAVPALRQLIPQFEQAAHAKVVLVSGSTGTLAQQIRNGAPADLFFAANDTAVDDLAKAGTIQLGARVVYARGRLVLAALKSRREITTLANLSAADIRRVAIANPAHAPYGLAAEQALRAAGLWGAVRPKLVYGESVQQAMQFLQSGSADAALVARSLAGQQPDLAWTLVDASLYAPLNQTAVVLDRSAHSGLAASFLELVKGPFGHKVLRSFGFLIPGEDF